MTMAAELAARCCARRWSPQATFAARLSSLERDLQAVLNRVPNVSNAPRVPATLRLDLDDLATLLPPAERALLDHLRARRPLNALDGTAGFRTVSRRNERLQRLLSRVTAYCGSCTRYDLMQPYDRPGHTHRPRHGPRRRMLPGDSFPPICVWVPRRFLAVSREGLKPLGKRPRARHALGADRFLASDLPRGYAPSDGHPG
jgi:hypothetical protein